MFNRKLKNMFKKKEAPKEKEVPDIMRNELKIKMNDGSVYDWWIDDWKGKKRVDPWEKFYKWFFSRNSDFFILQAQEEETIKTFTVRIHRVKVK